MSAYLYSYNQNSESSKVLAKALGIKRIKLEGSAFKGNANKTVINWGNSELSAEVSKCNVLNTAEAVTTCSDKLRFFNAVDGKCSIPDFTTDMDVAKEWLNDSGVVFCRTLLRASAGRGIVEAEDEEQLVTAGLYTRYVPKRQEYRLHICDGDVFLIQRKALSGEVNSNKANWRIRNREGGFIFARNEDHTPEQCVIDEALKAFNAIEGLTFGSVDVIYNEHRESAYVLEINTASGLQGSTVDDYVKALGKLV